MKRQSLIRILIAIACIGLLPNAQAISPAPDGGYPGGNTAEGQNALFGLTTGGYNTAVGFLSLRSNSTTSFNTAIGAGTLLANTADGNTATGAGALFSNTSGPSNTATGAFALFSNTTNGGNTANGYQALFYDTGFGNTADGYQALYSNTTGHENAANGGQALFSNTTGSFNTANGIQALSNNNTGSGNIALGYLAGIAQDPDANNNIYIGNHGFHGEVNTIAIGIRETHTNSTYIQGIFGATAPLGSAVFVNSFGHLGTLVSSGRFKQDIRDMAEASHALLALRPVTFSYRPELDPDGIPQFGLVAEEVEKINPALVVRDSEGRPYSVRYEQINAMLLNEFLKEHRAFLKEQRKIEAQEATITQLKEDFQSKLVEQQKQIKALMTGLQKVSAQVEMSRPAPQTVVKNQ
jgi:hypothetical protein